MQQFTNLQEDKEKVPKKLGYMEKLEETWGEVDISLNSATKSKSAWTISTPHTVPPVSVEV